MQKYLAKSNPEETIQEHTDNLLKNYQRLKKLSKTKKTIPSCGNRLVFTGISLFTT